MANTITNLLQDAYAAMEIVSREKADIIRAVTRNTTADAAAKDVTVRNPVAPQNSKYTITPSMTPLAAANMTYSNRTITLDTLEGYKFHFANEEEMGLKGSGSYGTLFQQNIAQAYRTLTDAISTALGALYYNSARAYGTAGTTPFASDLSAISAAKTILDKNGAPKGDRHLILEHQAGYNLLNLTQLTNVNQAGTSMTLREGSQANLFGFNVWTDDNIPTHTVGTSTGQDVNGGDAIGVTSITYDGGDGGTILVGDTVSISGDTSGPGSTVSRYVVNTAVTAAGGEIVINSPGLISAWADTTEIALGSTAYVANLAFSSDALVLAARPPKGGDAAVDETILTDPVTGISFRLAKYVGHHIINYELSTLYGVGVGNPEHMATIMG